MPGTATNRRGSGSGRWYALAAIGVAMLAVGLDVTVLNVALPTLSARLGASTAQLQWSALAAVLALWFPRLAGIHQGSAAPASVEVPVPADRR
jgi:hypothetical protein